MSPNEPGPARPGPIGVRAGLGLPEFFLGRAGPPEPDFILPKRPNLFKFFPKFLKFSQKFDYTSNFCSSKQYKTRKNSNASKFPSKSAFCKKHVKFGPGSGCPNFFSGRAGLSEPDSGSGRAARILPRAGLGLGFRARLRSLIYIDMRAADTY